MKFTVISIITGDFPCFFFPYFFFIWLYISIKKWETEALYSYLSILLLVSLV